MTGGVKAIPLAMVLMVSMGYSVWRRQLVVHGADARFSTAPLAPALCYAGGGRDNRTDDRACGGKNTNK